MMETDDDLMEGVECIQDDVDVAEMSIIGNEEEVFSEHLPDYKNMKLHIENDDVAKVKCEESLISMLPDSPSTDLLENIAASVASLQHGISSTNLQTFRIANAPVIKQFAIAPKPTNIVSKPAMSQVKKISLTNIRPKASAVIDSRQLVVLPSSGKFRFITPKSGTQTMQPQVVNTAGGQILQLRQGNTTQSVTKFAIVQGGDSNATNASKTVPRFLSLQQAQQMGLVSGGKIHQLISMSPIKQTAAPTNTPTVRPQIRQAITTLKSPAKILPAPPKINATKIIMTSLPQNVAIKSTAPAVKQTQMLRVENISGTGNTILASLSPGQKIDPNQIHQINVPGKGVQLVRLVATSNPPQQNLTSPVRIAPMTSTSSSQSSGAKVIGKPVMFDMQGNILQLTSADGKTIIPSSTSNIVTTTNQKSKMITVPFGMSKNQNIIQTPTPNVSMTITNMSSSQLDSMKKNDMSKSDKVAENMEVQISKTELIEEEMLDNDDTAEDSTIDSEQQLHFPTTSSIGQRDMKHIVMVPASYLQQMKGQNSGSKPLNIAANVELKQQEMESKNMESIELGMRPRKPCNCTKSQCLKLYCDCFANGEFCNNCNCNNCYNNLANEEFRQKAIKTCLERNPNAFRPKIGRAKNYGLEVIRRHNKGCNCKRSGCLKNYCECYEGKIACSANCKCVGCRNIEDSSDKRSMRKVRTEVVLGRMMAKNNDLSQFKEITAEDSKSGLMFSKKETIKNTSRKPWNYMTTDVIEAVCNCLVAQASESESFEGPDAPNATRYILEEFARCLQDMINTSQSCPTSALPDDVRGIST